MVDLKFSDLGTSKSSKTLVKEVRFNGTSLDQIKWYPQFGKYCFFPINSICLQTIVVLLCCSCSKNAHVKTPNLNLYKVCTTSSGDMFCGDLESRVNADLDAHTTLRDAPKGTRVWIETSDGKYFWKSW